MYVIDFPGALQNNIYFMFVSVRRVFLLIIHPNNFDEVTYIDFHENGLEFKATLKYVFSYIIIYVYYR